MTFGQGAPDEPALIARSLQHDREAFGLLVTRYAEPVLNLAHRLVGDPAEAQDVAQETFLAAFRALPGFRGESRFSTWLYRIAVNKCRDWLRAKQSRAERSQSQEDEQELADLAVETDTPERVLSLKELGGHLERALQELPLAYREAFLLKHVEGLSYEEMGRILNVGADALKMRVYKARARLRRRLAHLQGAAPVSLREDSL
jgi:RNA polymerase sigma-70 factor (ECF subfamily)